MIDYYFVTTNISNHEEIIVEYTESSLIRTARRVVKDDESNILTYTYAPMYKVLYRKAKGVWAKTDYDYYLISNMPDVQMEFYGLERLSSENNPLPEDFISVDKDIPHVALIHNFPY